MRKLNKERAQSGHETENWLRNWADLLKESKQLENQDVKTGDWEVFSSASGWSWRRE